MTCLSYLLLHSKDEQISTLLCLVIDMRMRVGEKILHYCSLGPSLSPSLSYTPSHSLYVLSFVCAWSFSLWCLVLLFMMLEVEAGASKHPRQTLPLVYTPSLCPLVSDLTLSCPNAYHTVSVDPKVLARNSRLYQQMYALLKLALHFVAIADGTSS